MKLVLSALAFLSLVGLGAASFAEELPLEASRGKTYVYKQSAGQPRRMEIYFPPGHDPANDRVPGLILFHGGGWSGGSLSQFRTACQYFASRGLVTATANYQMLSKQSRNALPEGESRKRVCVTDAKSAIRWFKQHAGELGIDPERVITGGGSAGGHVSVLATLQDGLDDPADPEDVDTSVVAYLLFNPAFALDDHEDSEIDVMVHLKRELAPAIVFFGTEDQNWKPGWDAAFKRLRSLGNTTTEEWLAEGQGHGFFNRPPWRELTLIAADRFLASHGLLQGEPTISAPESGERLVRGVVAKAERSQETDLMFTLRSQQETAQGSGRFHFVEQTQRWRPEKTAVIVCDVWDSHHCLNAVRRLDEFAPRLEAMLQAARDRGVTIIHAPSGCMAAYGDHPARQRAMQTPITPRLPEEINSWCSQIPAEERGEYPIDQSDGGEDDDPAEHAQWAKKLESMGRDPRQPWQRQLESITIDPQRDYISDRGDEIWSVLESRGIDNVILAGVHVNMCVLGRPFGLRQMVRNGKNAVLMRDLTDAMYNPQSWPYVSHFTGNDLIISHIERYVCPTMTSDQILGGQPCRFSNDTRPHVVMVIAEDPYDTKSSLPKFAVDALGKHFRVTVLHADEQDRNRIPGLEMIDEADVLFLSARRRLLPAADMSRLKQFIRSGKPVVAIRSSSHAFVLREGDPPAGYRDWPEFDAEVIGGNYTGSYPDELRSRVQLAEGAKDHPLMRGVHDLPLTQGGHMYKTGPLKPGTTVLLEGHVDGHDPEPVAWTFSRNDGGKTFYAALGHPEDFQQPAFVRLLANAVHWAAEISIPEQLAIGEPSS